MDLNRATNHGRANEIGLAILRDKALTPAEKIVISSNARAASYRAAIAAKQPLPDDNTLRAASQEALNRAIDARLATK